MTWTREHTVQSKYPSNENRRIEATVSRNEQEKGCLQACYESKRSCHATGRAARLLKSAVEAYVSVRIYLRCYSCGLDAICHLRLAFCEQMGVEHLCGRSAAAVENMGVEA